LRLLLDTHAALWFLTDDERLSGSARNQIEDDTNRVLLSAAVVWEVAIKCSLGKLSVPDEYVSLLLAGGAQPLPVSIEHAAAVEHLPWHHRDPFDRLLLAQASMEGATLVSNDAALRPYGVALVW
jgi:PIN domain nuclease of toxin-antitoxin system